MAKNAVDSATSVHISVPTLLVKFAHLISAYTAELLAAINDIRLGVATKERCYATPNVANSAPGPTAGSGPLSIPREPPSLYSGSFRASLLPSASPLWQFAPTGHALASGRGSSAIEGVLSPIRLPNSLPIARVCHEATVLCSALAPALSPWRMRDDGRNIAPPRLREEAARAAAAGPGAYQTR
ncbi:hypothetical protein GGX14DRAFT_569734 [Mycena pura]|uniref:Uncharacterized protein n=1 Tax=Mycena pura TaxID=153505 RepID=A0AAD6Y7U4_9AGAR|nr:hypothetical protein GGX14DRAFT_569734 [Mycena pura]